VLLVGYPFAVMAILFKCKNKLEDTAFKSKWGTLYDKLRYSERLSLIYYAVFMVRRLAFAVTIVTLQNHPYAQVQLMLLQTIFLIIY